MRNEGLNGNVLVLEDLEQIQHANQLQGLHYELGWAEQLNSTPALFRRRQADVYRVALLMTGSATACTQQLSPVLDTMRNWLSQRLPSRNAALISAL